MLNSRSYSNSGSGSGSTMMQLGAKLRPLPSSFCHQVRSSSSSGFSFQQTGDFVQDGPWHENAFTGDAFLRRSLARITPQTVLE